MLLVFLCVCLFVCLFLFRFVRAYVCSFVRLFFFLAFLFFYFFDSILLFKEEGAGKLQAKSLPPCCHLRHFIQLHVSFFTPKHSFSHHRHPSLIPLHLGGNFSLYHSNTYLPINKFVGILADWVIQAGRNESQIYLATDGTSFEIQEFKFHAASELFCELLFLH